MSIIKQQLQKLMALINVDNSDIDQVGMHDPILDCFDFNSNNSTLSDSLFAELLVSQYSFHNDISSVSEIPHSYQSSPIHQSVLDIASTISHHSADHVSNLKKSTRLKHFPRYLEAYQMNADGSVERYKARLVAKGYNQRMGFDYQETFSPIAKQTTVRIFMALVASHGWHLSLVDIINAFLNGNLEEIVYVQLLQGFSVKVEYNKLKKQQLVCKLHKSLYGLKQASRQWNSKFITTLLNTSVQALNDVKTYLSSQYKLKDLGNVKYFLGLEVARSNEGIVLCQRKYALNLLEEFGLLGAKPVTTPIDYNHKLKKKVNGDREVDTTKYRQLIGKLLYLTFTRPNISFAVQTLS
ncbi:F5K24.2-like protein [Theobroma cacao]|uniref:F5K24.2-like protein n=1 Tax=Theobroma cacao TaxID=3641 RepID=A0A061DS34_THECC|nr:F5K24.2-like protein [Theobroma cacao]